MKTNNITKVYNEKPLFGFFSIFMLAIALSACSASAVKNKKDIVVEYYDNKGKLVTKIKPANTIHQVSGNFELLNKGDGQYLSVRKFRKRVEAETKGNGISLNFENADIKEVVSLIIGKILNENYLIDPAVKGIVNLRTVKDLNKNTAFYILENILDIHGARIVRHKSHYRILPKNKTALGMVGLSANGHKPDLGYGYRVVPLEYISTKEMMTILKSVTYKNAIIRSNDKRNILILGGTSVEVSNMLDTVRLFDVDWMKGTSVGLVKVRYSNANDIIDDINKMLKIDESDKYGVGFVTLELIERLNSIMIITKRHKYIKKIKRWIDKFDVPHSGEGNKLYVYAVKNTNADTLADTMMELFTDGGIENVSDKNDTLSLGAEPVNVVFAAIAGKKTESKNPDKIIQASSSSGTKIIAVADSNSLLIMATPLQYAKIEDALEVLDIPPLQVLIEVTIMDIRLSDDLSYGMQWFFNSKSDGLSNTIKVGEALTFPQSFSYSAVKNTGSVLGLLGLLATDGKVNVLSSPSILVRNNEKASIRVGDQQPISTALVGAEGTIVATSVQYKDTGVLLEIKPTVNTSGSVNVDIVQEVTDIGEIDTATGQRSFLRRSIKTSVFVADGETIILGGLIRTNKAVSESGVPGLRDIPLIGFLFGKTVTTEQRTELIIMLTPKVIRNSRENTRVIEEYKRKFQNLFSESTR